MSSEQSSEVARVFDEWAREGRDEGMAERHGLSARPVLEALDIAAGDRFVDLGAGNAWAASWAQAAGADAFAVDVSAEMLHRARARETRPGGLVQASFERLPFADASFAFLFSMEALYYADDLQRALAEARRVAEPGGRLHALVDYYEGNPESRGWPSKTGVDMHRLSPEAWRTALREAGFADVGTERVRSEDGEGWRAEHGSLHVYGVRPG
jgi:ubiquinone/menaquinone biosynthesis C-methylase UbiE